MLDLTRPWSAKQILSSATSYNDIPTIESQTLSISPHILQAIAGILVKHNLHANWWIELLHRHIELPSTMAMIRSFLPHEGIICKAQPPSDLSYPCAIFLTSSSDWVPMEFTDKPAKKLPVEFLDEMGDFLASSSLQGRISLATALSLNDNSAMFYEYRFRDSLGSVYVSDHPAVGSQWITTAWSTVKGNDGSVRIMGRKGCEQDHTGRHEPKDLPGLWKGHDAVPAILAKDRARVVQAEQ